MNQSRIEPLTSRFITLMLYHNDMRVIWWNHDLNHFIKHDFTYGSWSMVKRVFPPKCGRWRETRNIIMIQKWRVCYSRASLDLPLKVSRFVLSLQIGMQVQYEWVRSNWNLKGHGSSDGLPCNGDKMTKGIT